MQWVASISSDVATSRPNDLPIFIGIVLLRYDRWDLGPKWIRSNEASAKIPDQTTERMV